MLAVVKIIYRRRQRNGIWVWRTGEMILKWSFLEETSVPNSFSTKNHTLTGLGSNPVACDDMLVQDRM